MEQQKQELERTYANLGQELNETDEELQAFEKKYSEDLTRDGTEESRLQAEVAKFISEKAKLEHELKNVSEKLGTKKAEYAVRPSSDLVSTPSDYQPDEIRQVRRPRQADRGAGG